MVYRFTATWTVSGDFTVEALSKEEALDKPYGDIGLDQAKNVQYVDDSFVVDEENVDKQY